MQEKKYNDLQQRLANHPHEDYPVTSRVHALRSFGKNWFVKRDDELGFSISGTKFRKYRTLIPYLRQFKEVVVTGGAFSNHVLGITQLLIENGIIPKLVLTGSPPKNSVGNYLFLQALVPSIAWTTEKVEEGVQVLAEGGSCFISFLGAMSLPLDIVRNEQENGVAFDHVFIEAGTGLSAAALLLGFAYLEKETMCRVLLMADSEAKFLEELARYHAEFEGWLGEKCPFPTRFSCERPSLAPSFGSTNAALFEFLVETARSEGFFLDPIYSAKLFYHAKQKIPYLAGPTLILHSGGALTLSGFQSQLFGKIENKLGY